MLGLGMIHGSTTLAMLRYFERYYGSGFVSADKFEDFILTTGARKSYADIGMDAIYSETAAYVLANMSWINVCMFVNADFRECFRDAVLIEKALLQVSRTEYLDFREEMSLPVKKQTQDGEKKISVDLSKYDSGADTGLGTLVAKGINDFFATGMGDAYAALMNEMDDDTKNGVLFVAYNIAYVINALDKNGVFRKYVTIVIENVKKQLLS